MTKSKEIHVVTIHTMAASTPELRTHQAQCSCGWQSLTYAHMQAADTQADTHINEMQENDAKHAKQGQWRPTDAC